MVKALREAVMLTPQAIKDQEFQTKFRGYDSLEVKSYLELLGEDFFELLEQNRTHAEEIESLVAEQELLRVEKERLENDLRDGQVGRDEIEAEIQEEYSRKDEDIEKYKDEIAELKETVSQLENEKATYLDLVSDLEEKVSVGSDEVESKHSEIEKLKNELKQVEERNSELEKEGQDFKTTIRAAQKFADNLRESSELEAMSAIEQAKIEVGKIRNEAREKLADFPQKIEELQLKKNQVRNELKAILDKYMVGLEVPAGVDENMAENDLSDLFQRIQLPDGENEESGTTISNIESP